MERSDFQTKEKTPINSLLYSERIKKVALEKEYSKQAFTFETYLRNSPARSKRFL